MFLSADEIMRRTARERDEAQQLLDTNGKLPFWAWAALVAQWASIPTVRTSEGWRGGVCGPTYLVKGRSYGLGNIARDGYVYWRPDEIAKKGSEWERASGGKMAQWCLMLESPDERRAALRACGHLYQGDEDETGESEEELDARRRRILAQTKRIAAAPMPTLTIV